MPLWMVRGFFIVELIEDWNPCRLMLHEDAARWLPRLEAACPLRFAPGVLLPPHPSRPAGVLREACYARSGARRELRQRACARKSKRIGGVTCSFANFSDLLFLIDGILYILFKEDVYWFFLHKTVQPKSLN